jgi:hypothetical protein
MPHAPSDQLDVTHKPAPPSLQPFYCMLRTDDPRGCHNPPIPLDPQTRQQTREIASELAAIARTGEVLPCTLIQRQMRCGRAGCRCHADPPRLHGPYWQWTRKVNNKTITRWLSPQQATDCGRWIDNDRRLRELLARLEAIGIGQLEAAQRQD